MGKLERHWSTPPYMRTFGCNISVWTVIGKGGFRSTAGYADVSFVLYVCHCIYDLEGGICLGFGGSFFCLLRIWLDGFLYGLGFDLVQGLLDQRVGSEGWRQSPAMGGIRCLLGPGLDFLKPGMPRPGSGL